MMAEPAAPEVMHIGQARLTAGLDRVPRIDLAAHRAIFGPMPLLAAGQLVEMAEAVELRGRGGAAFPFARKLTSVADVARRRKCETVIVVNATEGEPGSAKDKMLLLRSPYLVLGGALLAARALGARQIIVGVSSDGLPARSVRAAAKAEPGLKGLVDVVTVPDRFISGEGGALVNALNGKIPLPPGRKVLPSDSGIRGLPTLLSNAETFAQLSVLAMLGPDGYASTGTDDQPGTLLLTVGGTSARPAVVEVPAGIPLGMVLDACGAAPQDGVLVGGYHGMWLPTETAFEVPVSRSGLAAAGGTLGAGIVLPLGGGTCPIGEVARVVAYLAKESAGQCGPCKLGLPGVARSMRALADGSGGVDALDTARRAAAAARGRGACAHPDGVFRFVMSALDVFSDDLTAHLFRGSCGRPVKGILPLGTEEGSMRLMVDWTRCQGHGLCASLTPQLIQLDRQGYPAFLDIAVPDWLEKDAEKAVAACPTLALRLVESPATAGPPPLPAPPRKQLPAASGSRPRMARGSGPRQLAPPDRRFADNRRAPGPRGGGSWR
jgi:NADH:ubiquinone oxidoreductase subunit F (NADH-binding)/ferredoxin